MRPITPTLLKIISIFFIIYGILDLGEFFMPVETEDTIKYSVPFLGVVHLFSGIGMLFLKEWARKWGTLGCVYAMIISIIGLRYSLNIELFLGLIFISLYGLIFMYLTRPSTVGFFMKTPKTNLVKNASGEFGYEPSNPIPVNDTSGERLYLEALECKCGVPFLYRRGKTEVGPDGQVLDEYELVCMNNKHKIHLYLDMYHGSQSKLIPKGLTKGVRKGKSVDKCLNQDPNVRQKYVVSIPYREPTFELSRGVSNEKPYVAQFEVVAESPEEAVECTKVHFEQVAKKSQVSWVRVIDSQGINVLKKRGY